MDLAHNLFECWDHFSRGKRKRTDIQYFERNLEDCVFQLQNDLITLQYQHDAYDHFYVSDPKQRRISKASGKDRLVHQIVYEVLTTVFDRKFIFYSLFSRAGKGTHIEVTMLHHMIRKVSANGKQPCYTLKMGIKHFLTQLITRFLKLSFRKISQTKKC